MPDFGLTAVGGSNFSSPANPVFQALNPFPEAGTFQSMTVQFGLWANPADARLGLYTGAGASVDDPNGITLVEDLGEIGVTAAGTYTLNSTLNPALTAGTRYWLAYKSNDGGALRLLATAGTVGDFAGDAIHSTGGGSADETVAWAAAVGAGTVVQITNSFRWYLTYAVGGGGGGLVGPLVGRSKLVSFGNLIGQGPLVQS